MDDLPKYLIGARTAAEERINVELKISHDAESTNDYANVEADIVQLVKDYVAGLPGNIYGYAKKSEILNTPIP